MSMVTSCPKCNTTFRVKHEELRASRGRVRCGQCSEVFSAFNSLATLEEPPAETMPATVPIQSDIAGGVPSLQSKVSSASAGSAKPLSFIDMAAEKAARQYRHTWDWFGGVLLLLALLVAQVAYSFRDPIAAFYPELKPYLQSYCDLLQCAVNLPKVSEMLTIESSDLQADPNRSNLIVLTALLRNRAPFAQAYPLLELTFTDTQDHMLARRVFRASDYLAGNAKPNAGMQANSEFSVKLYIDSDDLKPAGYRLLLFYP